jgi:hypothetical protein
LFQSTSVAVGTYLITFDGAFAKSNTTSAGFIFTMPVGTAGSATVVGSGFYAVTDNATSFTNFFLNHSISTNGGTGTGFTTSAITATRSACRIHFTAYVRVTSATSLIIRIASNTASSGFSLNSGSGFTITKVG